ncbi:hypothetical protein [Deinococcus multiflagellatus]|uniref:Uncharacterized protein n=1 Tax=Deinococcus multiflagellatus TaxID=1656887 RepID=A0ABW1ZQP9_9DEIO|nr:hypothetical protein [Deinococcus multiflagellatus]MBZ9715384.1 hypothetical protein [Deinococcus multiflagellatus]
MGKHQDANDLQVQWLLEALATPEGQQGPGEQTLPTPALEPVPDDMSPANDFQTH